MFVKKQRLYTLQGNNEVETAVNRVSSFYFSHYSTHKILTVFHFRVPFPLVMYAEDINGTPVHYLPREVALLATSGCLWSLDRLAGGRRD